MCSKSLCISILNNLQVLKGAQIAKAVVVSISGCLLTRVPDLFELHWLHEKIKKKNLVMPLQEKNPQDCQEFLKPVPSRISNGCLQVLYELRCEKTGLRGFRPGPTQTRLCSYRRWLEA